jgi:hypothetical protein
MTRDEVAAFMAEYRALLGKYSHLREDAPDEAHSMLLRFFAVPEEPA